jgi:hypothetical protein
VATHIEVESIPLSEVALPGVALPGVALPGVALPEYPLPEYPIPGAIFIEGRGDCGSFDCRRSEPTSIQKKMTAKKATPLVTSITSNTRTTGSIRFLHT